MRMSEVMVCSPPTRWNSLSWRTLRSLGCRSMGRSPISSRKSVPPFAASILPILFLSAPVKAPFSWPKSSLSRSSRGSAGQLTVIKGWLARGLCEWMYLARTPLPVPLSPVRSTDESS